VGFQEVNRFALDGAGQPDALEVLERGARLEVYGTVEGVSQPFVLVFERGLNVAAAPVDRPAVLGTTPVPGLPLLLVATLLPQSGGELGEPQTVTIDVGGLLDLLAPQTAERADGAAEGGGGEEVEEELPEEQPPPEGEKPVQEGERRGEAVFDLEDALRRLLDPDQQTEPTTPPESVPEPPRQRINRPPRSSHR
jgi:hypothetical protein